VREYAFRTLRDEVFRWVETGSSADGATDHPLYPAVRGVVAYGRFVRGALDEAVDEGLAALSAAERLGAPTLALAERVLGNAVFYREGTDEALPWMDRMVEAAQATGLDAPVARAQYMRSVARSSLGRVEDARSAAAAARVAAERSGSPTALAQARYAEGLTCERDDPDLAVALLRESAELAAGVRNRWMRAFARTEELSVRARRGEVDAALHGFRDVVDTWFRGGDWANQWLSLRHLFGVFVALGGDEPAAVLHGAIAAAGATTALPFEPADAARTRALVEVARGRLGAGPFDAAVARGRAMRDEEVVRLVLRHLGSAHT
jgi:hypothetical protein